MSALAPVREKRCSRQRRSSKHQADLVVPAAKCRTEQSLMVRHCRRNYGTKLRLVSLKPRLVAAFCCILAFSAVTMAMKNRQLTRADSEASAPPPMQTTSNGVGGWEATKKTLFGTGWGRLWAILKWLCVIATLVLCVLSITGIPGVNGVELNIVDDNGGKSMAARLAILIPGALLLTGGALIAGFRIKKRMNVDEIEYQKWKRGDEYYEENYDATTPYGKLRKRIGTRSSYNLLLGWFAVIVLIGLGVLFYGYAEGNVNEMLNWTIGISLGVGLIGLGSTYFLRKNILKADEVLRKAAAKQGAEQAAEQAEDKKAPNSIPHPGHQLGNNPSHAVLGPQDSWSTQVPSTPTETESSRLDQSNRRRLFKEILKRM